MAACGGGGGGGGGGGTSQFSGIYELLPSPSYQWLEASTFISEANEQGSRSFSFVDNICHGVYCSTQGTLYVRDTSKSGIFNYEAVTSPYDKTPEEFLIEANEKGARGFAFAGRFSGPEGGFSSGALVVVGDLYEHDSSKSAVFSYELVPKSVDQTSGEFLAEVNAEGSRGFSFVKNNICTGSPCSTYYALYEHDSSKSAVFSYEIVPKSVDQTSGEFLAEVNAEGSRGFSFVGNIYGSTYYALYEHDSSKNTAYNYELYTSPSEQTSGEFLAEANAAGTRGFAYVDNFCFSVSCSIAGSLYVTEL